jgi:hypothetical protein
LQGGEALDPKAMVPVRLISLEKCPDDFAVEVTRATNTQNRIERRDFVALDPCQTRLVGEMRLEGRSYVIRPGDSIPHGVEGCDFQEAATALACAHSLKYAVQAKREVSMLWADVKREPYCLLFNDSLNAEKLWRSVRILRAVEGCLKNDIVDIPKGALIASHGNCFILYRVFHSPELVMWRDEHLRFDSVIESVRTVTKREVSKVCGAFQSPSEYPQTVFKNATRCHDLDKTLARKEKNNTANEQHLSSVALADSPPKGYLF